MNQLLVALIGLVIGIAGGVLGRDLVRNAASQAEVVDEVTINDTRGIHGLDEALEPNGADIPDLPREPGSVPDAGEADASMDEGSEEATVSVASATDDDGTPVEETDETNSTDTEATGDNVSDEAPVEAPVPVLLLIIGQVRDAETFQTRYVDALPALYTEFGGERLAAGDEVEALEGLAGFETYLVSRWPSREAALAFWNSEAHEELRQARIDEAWGDFDTILLPAELTSAEEAVAPSSDESADGETDTE